ncbi:hypothetical protein CAPTEDRAFT_185686 [Capitella teleta]|uniref:BACK domain-containing protein n=1 Tax=Capitella teleta TaxID=283909 RepID=R7V1U6_CAPTE|nr:hypothetical protein CAPTEDRAFT_185686 [Capitella teleta]|eukprot:ELU10296.1 hypothetical protein CAPTEDRAFT_185686 [Capitella teleta]
MHLLQEGDLIEVLEANASQEVNFLFIQKWMRSAEGRTKRFDDLMQHNGHWNTLPPMPTARRSHSSIYHNHYLYVVGGCDDCGWDCRPLNSVDALDMRNLQWNHLPPLPREVDFASLAIVSDNLFVLGGCSGLNWAADVHEFDSTQQTWRQRSPMPEICEWGVAVSFDDHVYVVGGQDRRCMRFNPRNNTWTSLQRPQFIHSYGPSLVLNGNIVVFGGLNDDSIEEYSPLTDYHSAKITVAMKQKQTG